MTSPISSSEATLSALAVVPTDLLICVFVHGFKGDNDTFVDFPSRLQHILSHTLTHANVECVAFPAYETKGDLSAAVERFVDWLAEVVVHKEVAGGLGGGAGKAKVMLCGHSMGGLLIADAVLEIARTRVSSDQPLWPHIIGIIAFDTPYLGLHPNMFKNKAEEAISYVNAARGVVSGVGVLSALGSFGFGKKSTAPQASSSQPRPQVLPSQQGPFADKNPKSPWEKWAPAVYGVGGALLAGAAAGAVYHQRDNLNLGLGWATDHLKYVGTMWDENKLKARVDGLLKLNKESGIVFRCFYTILPLSPGQLRPRTFVILPYKDAPAAGHFIPAPNTLAADEIAAHTGMFTATTNSGYYALGLRTAEIIGEAIVNLGDDEKTMGVNEVINQAEEMERNRAEVERDGVAAQATADNKQEELKTPGVGISKA